MLYKMYPCAVFLTFHCTILRHIALYYIQLRCKLSYCVLVCRIILYYTVMYCVLLRYIVLCYTAHYPFPIYLDLLMLHYLLTSIGVVFLFFDECICDTLFHTLQSSGLSTVGYTYMPDSQFFSWTTTKTHSVTTTKM